MSYEDVMNVVLPHQGRHSAHVTGHYGEHRANGPHGGSDFNYEGGQTGINVTHPAVHSPVAGTVTFVGGQYGTIKIRDADGNSHEILHTNSQSVTVGQAVAAGDEVGSMGGRGPHGEAQYAQHVHYQMKDSQGHAINPETYWNERPSVAATTAHTNPGPTHQHATPASVLQQGSHGMAVDDMQHQLRELGYAGAHGKALEVDGHFGPNTRHALEAFQRDHDLAADGIAGPRTQRGLDEAMAHRHPPAELGGARPLNDPGHAAYAMFQQGLSGIHQLNAAHAVAPSPRDSRLAAALTVEATAKGLSSIDHVVLSDDASRVFAVQGAPQSLGQKTASVDTLSAIDTSLEQSSARWPKAAQHAEQTQAVQREELQAQQQRAAAQHSSATASGPSL